MSRRRSGAADDVQPDSRNKVSYPPEVGRSIEGESASEGEGGIAGLRSS